MSIQPSDVENRYFHEQELKRHLEARRREQEAMVAQEKARLKELHYMHCPKCGQKLLVERYHQTEVDVCPSCKGLWLDAKELDAILASAQGSGPLKKFLKVLGA
jgi:RNA polymerase-binding transcription factor DksA